MKIKQMTIPVFIPHLGCPNQCAFCNQNEISGKYNIPGIPDIEKNIKSYTDSKSRNINHIELAFFGGSFTGIDKSLQEKYLSFAFNQKKTGIINGIRLSTRPDYINDEIINNLKKYSVDIVELGVQSFCDDVLNESLRGHQASDVYDSIKLLKKNSINFGIQLMPGLPGDDFNKSIFSAKEAARLNPACIRIYPTIVLKDTPLEKLYFEKKYFPLSLENAIKTTSEMLKIFYKKNIPVIRIGLHPLNKDEENNIIAGPYAHNFGFLAKSRIKRDLLENKLTVLNTELKPGNIIILLPNKNTEEFIGNKKDNIQYLQNKFDKLSINYKINNCEKLEFIYGS